MRTVLTKPTRRFSARARPFRKPHSARASPDHFVTSLRSPMPRPRNDPSLMRSLGQFFGEVWKGVASDPAKLRRQGRVTKRHVEQKSVDTPDGKLILRRTTIEEIIVPPDEPSRT